MRKTTVELTLYEVRALGICYLRAQQSGLIGPFLAQLSDDEEEALTVTSMRSALIKLNDAENQFPEVEALSPQEKLEVAAARAEVEREQAWLVDPTRKAS